jgi:hypothetical protein
VSAPLLLALGLALLPGATPFDPPKARPAPRLTGEPATLAIVVGNNRSSKPGRPPLHYADDDAAKYFHLFSALTGEGDTLLLTELDRDTARLFPELLGRSRPPTGVELRAAGEALGRRAAALQAAGRPVRLYFVFAGHGDVEAGQGFIELTDGPFTADDLQELLQGVAATETHVILDSCNAYFVVNPRKPGGQRFVTPQDAAERLARRLPDVGVFLSTSAQAETFEWSELQAGIFSHAVRSGLLGAADANGDGLVSYQELAGFVETAAAGIRNPRYRPRLFARGPNGDDVRAILEVPPTARARLLVDEAGPVRVALRDADGLRWLDAHKEAGATLRTWLPPGRSGTVEVERLGFDQAGGVERVASYRLEQGGVEPVRLASLAPWAPNVSRRGADEIFRSLFDHPYGPRALADFLGGGGMERAPEQWPVRERGESGLTFALRAGAFSPQVRLAGGAGSPTPARPRFGAGFDVSGAAALELLPVLAVEAEVGYLQTSSGRLPLAVPGEIYAGTGPPGATFAVRGVPALLGVRLEWPRAGARPYLTGSLGWTWLLLEARPDYTPVLRHRGWVTSGQAGLGLIVLERPGGLSAAVEVRYLVTASMPAMGLETSLTALRANLLLEWRP